MLGRILVAAALLCSIGFAQDEDKVKKDILEKVKGRLDKEREALLDKIGKMIDDELGIKSEGGTKNKLSEIDKKLRALDAEKAKLQTEKKELAWWEKDAKLLEEITKEDPSPQEAQDLFKEAMDDHTNKDFEKSIPKFKKLFYFYAHNDKKALVDFATTCCYNVACGYALSGKKDEGIEWLEFSFKYGFAENKCSCHDTALDHIKEDTDLESLRDDARYKEMIKHHKEKN